MQRDDARAPAVVNLLALPETTPAALYALYEVLSAAGVAWRELTGEAVAARRIDARIVARRRRSYASPVGVPIAPDAALADIASSDVVVVTDLALPLDGDPRGRWPREATWLREQFERGACVCSVCTGSVLLAEAGLLDGLEATTHWAATALFRRCYPAVRLRAQRILCPAAAGHRIVTSGGAASWEELALYLIARLCGHAEAVRIAKVFVLGDRSEGQLPFAAMARARRHDDAAIAACQRWIAGHYAVANPVQRMAREARLPERTFKRRFNAATGYTPVGYVQALRIEEAKHLLEATGEPVEAIAHAVGYDDAAFFRRLFARLAGTTPARYRRRFAAGAGGAG